MRPAGTLGTLSPMRRRIIAVIGALAVTFAALVVPPPAPAAAADLAAARLRLIPVISGLSTPVAIAWRQGDSRMFVAEKPGRVRAILNGQIVATVLTLSVSNGPEQGLLGITFSRDGTKLYVSYTDTNGDSRIAEYKMQNGVANPATRRQLLFQDQPAGNHNGGKIFMGSDDLLYIAFGDGGGAGDPNGNGQKLSTLLGKILRIDPRPTATKPYRIPPGNPFIGQAGKKPEIWMYGLRNPWQFSIDRGTGDMWIGDVGQHKWEEVDYAAAGQSAGANWGWRRFEGFEVFNAGTQAPGARDPLLVRSHDAGDCSITGGHVYRGTTIPLLQGAYVFADFCTGRLRAVVQANGVVTQSRLFGVMVPSITTFGQGPGGELYPTLRTGEIYRLARA
jgi:glucose/arabinose dehydrogenase